MNSYYTTMGVLTVFFGLFLGALGWYGISFLCSQVLSAAARTFFTKYFVVLYV